MKPWLGWRRFPLACIALAILVTSGARVLADLTVSGNVVDVIDRAARLLGHVTVDSGTVTSNAGTNLNTSALALDATLTNRLPAGSTPANGESNAITTSRLGAYNWIFNGSTWDRWTGAVSQSGTWTVQPGNTANTTPWLMDIRQFGGVNLSTGTGAAATGVPRVTVSNDSLLSDTTAAISITTSGATCSPSTNCATISLNSAAACAVLLTSLGTGGTVQFESSVDNGTFQAQALSNLATGAVVTSASATATLIGGPASMQTFRVRASALTSGTITGTIRCSTAPGILQILGGQLQIWDQVTKVGVIAGTTALKTDMASIAGTATSTAAAGVQKVGVVGNANGAFDAANNATAPTNQLVVGGELQTGAQATAGTAGQVGRFVVSLDRVAYARLGGPVQLNCTADNIAATLTQLTNCGQPGAGLKIYVTDVVAISTTATAGNMTLEQGTGTNCGTGTAAYYPVGSTARTIVAPANTSTTGPLQIHFFTPFALTANNALCVLGVATNTTNILVTAFIAP